MKFTSIIERIFEKYLPSPFALAIILTFITFVLALFLTKTSSITYSEHLNQLVSSWESGLWNNGLLVFAYQMMLILVLGHILVLSSPVSKIIDSITKQTTSTSQAAVMVGVSTMLVAFFNWGLGLIFGALLTRKIGERFFQEGRPLNYPLIGAAGYSGLMVWHGGISGSAPIKINESGHIASLISDPAIKNQLPDAVYFGDTVFSSANLIIFVITLIMVSIVLFLLGREERSLEYDLTLTSDSEADEDHSHFLDRSFLLPVLLSILIFSALYVNYREALLNLAITPNMINLFLLGLALLAHGSIKRFGIALGKAIRNVSGILIQFPLYFGIMALMKSSGLVTMISESFVQLSTPDTLPIFTFLSAGLVNVFVPSGGGQWVVQGPIALEAAIRHGVDIPKMIMAIAYGDQLTNMLQPFWALPLLAITGIKAEQLLPYTLLLMIVAGVIYLLGLIFLY